MPNIKQIKITNGTFWIEIDAIDLRLLCGCPADVSKFLAQEELIKTITSSDGRLTVSGPNAILLSDKQMQNGRVCNFSEFPLMHMLYMQGMLVPNSPNFGQTPYFIGKSEIIKQQLEYLFVGNYGVTNQDVLNQAYKDDFLGKEIMASKLCFANHNFKEYTNLLRVIPVEDNEETTIKDTCLIKRTSENIFEVIYKAETVEIDLNLESDQTYGKTFTLPKTLIPSVNFGVVNIGSGDGWSQDRPCFSSLIISDGKKYLVDAGPNLGYVLEQLGLSVNDIDGIFQTHIHDDHICGYEFLWGREKPLDIFLVKPVKIGFMLKLNYIFNASDEEINKKFNFIELDFDQWNNIENLEVIPYISLHPVETSIFMFRKQKDGVSKTFAHFGDLVSFMILDKITENGSRIGIKQETADKVREQYLIPADFKKIDVGGGLIHGMAENFVNDKSTLKSLGHIGRHLTPEELEVGISEPFGNIQILIP